MSEILNSIFWGLLRRVVGRSPREADLLSLRHQVTVLQRQLGQRPKFTRWDRLLFAVLYHLQPDMLRSVSIIRPETVVRWHRAGFRLFWRRRSRGKPGRPRVPVEVRRLIRQIGIDNPLWGAPQIHGELLKLGTGVSESTVANYLVRGRRPPSQG
jgi:hypothetical protein